MALGLKFLHTPKPRRYNHKFIYYDPEKEEREEREVRVNKELGIKDDKPFKTSIKRGTFRRYQAGEYDEQEIAQARRRSNIRFLIILAALFAMVGLLYFVF